MINKLKSKVFFILMFSISFIVLGTILIFAYLNYNNTINAATSTLESFNDFSKMQGIDREPKIDESTDASSSNQEIKEQNAYYFMIDNGRIIDDGGRKNKEVESYALLAYSKNKESGIIDNYVYKTKQMKDTRVMIAIIENNSISARIKLIYIISAIGSILAILVTYIISKKLTNMIVQPVAETMEKQKQFISDASHELKTPLAVIEANVEVLESNVGESKWMTYIKSEINSMDKLINNLLFLAKAENTNNDVKKEKFNLSEEINMVGAMFESMAYEKKVKIKSKVAENIEFIGNKEDIKHVVSVLIDNAIMHTKEDGEVILELEKEKGNIVIQVKNQGDPIPEEEREKIFERFYRIDKSRNRKEKRYGLGLAIAKSIVNQYKGKIDVNCRDGYTTFKVIF